MSGICFLLNIRGEKVLKQNECLEVLFELNVSSSNHLLDAKVKLITNDAHQPVHTVILKEKWVSRVEYL